MKKKLLTINDLYNFYSKKNESMIFNAQKSGYNIAVQSEATFEVVKDKNSEGLLYGKVKAFHDLTNKNRSHIKTNVLEDKMYSIKDRPILADIVDKTDKDGNTYKDFSGHTMEYDEDNDKIIYIERPVGHFVNPENIHLEYDSEKDRNFVCSDVVVYEQYTDTCDILRRRGTVDCSVELCIRDMSWNNEDKVLMLNDFYVQGCTLLGEDVSPGMDGSNLTLMDFSEKNNSLFTSNNELEVIQDSLERINTTLSGLYNYVKKEEVANPMNKLQELLEKYNKTVEDITFEYDNLTDEELENAFKEAFELAVTNPINDNEPVVENLCKTFEISHDDIRCGLYELLSVREEENNEWYWICSVYDTYFVYCCDNKYYGQKYIKDNDTVSFDGEPYRLYAEFLTETEKATIDQMRENYESLVSKLNQYQEAEEIADKLTIFNDESYSAYLDTTEFKELMLKDNLLKYSKDELVEKADAALGKIVKANKTFKLTSQTGLSNKEEKHVFAFASAKKDTSFLDSLLSKSDRETNI